jgi:hypothetical protein
MQSLYLRSYSQYRKELEHTVACLLGNATNNLWVLDLTLDLLDIRQAVLQLIIIFLISLQL